MDVFNAHAREIMARDVHMVQLVSYGAQEKGAARLTMAGAKHSFDVVGSHGPKNGIQYIDLLNKRNREIERYEISSIQWNLLRYFHGKLGNVVQLPALRLEHWLQDSNIWQAAGNADPILIDHAIRWTKRTVLREGIARPFAYELSAGNPDSLANFTQKGDCIADKRGSYLIEAIAEYVSLRLAKALGIDREIDDWNKD